MSKKKTIALILAAVIVLGFIIGGIIRNNDIKNASDPVATEDISSPKRLINPLTGEKLDKDISSARPYCIMINNHAVARPSVGLSHASIIYEALVEGDITRLMAIFSDVEGFDIGHIRSCRPCYSDLALAYDGIYVHWGASSYTYNYLEQCGIDNIDQLKLGDAPGFFRESGSTAMEHRAMINGTKLSEYAKAHNRIEHEDGYDTSYGLSFAENAVNQCEKESANFTVQYINSTKTEFIYNEDKQCYNAYMSGTEYKDRTDSTFIDIANVLILNVPYKIVDNVGKPLKDMDLTGSGTGYLATGGKYVEINWSRNDLADNFHYTLTDGTPLNLSVGRTYICIAPLDMGGSVTW